MRIGYDRQADALVLVLTDGEVAASREAAPGVIVNLDHAGAPVSVEVLRSRTWTGPDGPLSLEIEFDQ
ncbi:MAG TPA: DUF2283 domain-containing protein [bacterium]|nr:DUF2283 domain-containing protein [bacterium]